MPTTTKAATPARSRARTAPKQEISALEIDYTKPPTESELLAYLGEDERSEMQTALEAKQALDVARSTPTVDATPSVAEHNSIVSAVKAALEAEGKNATAEDISSVIRQLSNGDKKGSGRYTMGISNEEIEQSRKAKNVDLVPDLEFYTQASDFLNHDGLLPAGVDPHDLRLLKNRDRPYHWYDTKSGRVFHMPKNWTPDRGNHPETKLVKVSLQGGSVAERLAIA